MQKKSNLTDKIDSEAGITLLEVLVVLAIMAAIALVIGPRVLKYIGKAKTETSAIQIENIATGVELYFLETGKYPTTQEGLQALIIKPDDVEGWDGPYMKKAESITDPWGQTYHYEYPGKHSLFDIYSLGADNTEGGQGDNEDITNWGN